MADPPTRRIAVVGAGTMGTGIAEVAATAGFPVAVYDVADDALRRSRQRLAEDLHRRVARGRLDRAAADDALGRIEWTGSFDELGAADVVIEAAPEDLALKQDLFRRIDAVCGRAGILASNTSSLSITALAAATARPERVVGMHFFNPVPAMALVEVIRGAQTDEAVVEDTLALARTMGKTPVRAADRPGFVVNRVARPFTGEAVRLLAEGRASVETIDWIVREAGGYRMGPFELIDLLGVDVNLAVSRAIYEGFFHDPRYRPHPMQQQMADAGWLGRKSGRGFYDYTDARKPSGRPVPGPAEAAAELRGPVAVIGDTRIARELRDLLRSVGAGVLESHGETERRIGGATGLAEAAVVVEAGFGTATEKALSVAAIDARLHPDALLLTLTLTASATEAARLAARPDRVVGMCVLPPFARGTPVEIQAALQSSTAHLAQAHAFWRGLGLVTAAVGDGAAGVFARIQAMLCHEALVALEAGVASADEIDTAMRLGMNYPQGPIERAEAIGLDLILAVVEGLLAEHGDPRYRPSPWLRRLVAAGHTSTTAGR